MKRTFYAFAQAEAEAFPALANAEVPPEEDELLLPLSTAAVRQQRLRRCLGQQLMEKLPMPRRMSDATDTAATRTSTTLTTTATTRQC